MVSQGVSAQMTLNDCLVYARDHALRNLVNGIEVRQCADNLNIRASHSGQLGTLNVELGQNVGSGEQIGQINILDNYKIVVRIDENYIDRVEAGLQGKVERQGKKYDVTLYKVYPEVAEGTFKADLRLDGVMPENIRVGQTYYINLQLEELHRDGATIVMVTHSQRDAAHADYVINLFDGQVVENLNDKL